MHLTVSPGFVHNPRSVASPNVSSLCRLRDFSGGLHSRKPIFSRPEKISSRKELLVANAQALDNPLDAPVDLPSRMNNVPHQREMRQFFYHDVSTAVKSAVAAGVFKMTVRCTVPETNPEMDVYRIGTLLELVRELATTLVADGKRVKVCVQQSMGQGVFQGMPLSLAGVRRIMEAMDWGEAIDFVAFGQVGSDQIDDFDHYILIAPQNVVGSTIMTNLTEMVDSAVARQKPIILINPILKDIPSSGGVMGIRGRKERMEMVASFEPAYHFRLLYRMGSFWPIKGALRRAYGGEWELYKRVDLGKRQEEYQLMGLFEKEPGSGEITDCFERNRKSVRPKRRW
ncbi:hypothetical protein BSKO_00866 [Bryopsis sp. KO-2023]|nr:hypothetical protein BSKO_00866 [Bryopsis sp. KO-2023]